MHGNCSDHERVAFLTVNWSNVFGHDWEIIENCHIHTTYRDRLQSWLSWPWQFVKWKTYRNFVFRTVICQNWMWNESWTVPIRQTNMSTSDWELCTAVVTVRNLLAPRRRNGRYSNIAEYNSSFVYRYRMLSQREVFTRSYYWQLQLSQWSGLPNIMFDISFFEFLSPHWKGRYC